jgi:hypothetical protein
LFLVGEKRLSSTMNPGLAYAAMTWQIAREAIVPLNSIVGGRHWWQGATTSVSR